MRLAVAIGITMAVIALLLGHRYELRTTSVPAAVWRLDRLTGRVCLMRADSGKGPISATCWPDGSESRTPD